MQIKLWESGKKNQPRCCCYCDWPRERACVVKYGKWPENRLSFLAPSELIAQQQQQQQPNLTSLFAVGRLSSGRERFLRRRTRWFSVALALFWCLFVFTFTKLNFIKKNRTSQNSENRFHRQQKQLWLHHRELAAPPELSARSASASPLLIAGGPCCYFQFQWTTSEGGKSMWLWFVPWPTWEATKNGSGLNQKNTEICFYHENFTSWKNNNDFG